MRTKSILLTLALLGALVAVTGWALAEVSDERDRPAGDEDAEDEDAEEATEGAEEATEDEAEEPAAPVMPTDRAGFVAAMSEAITKVGGRPTCDEEGGRCHYRRRGEGGRTHEIHLWYSDQSRTIYIFAPWLITASQDSSATPTVLRHLMAINRMLDVARFEWNPESGEVRLSAVQNVDSNYDARALVGLLRVLEEGATRYATILARIAELPDRAPVPPRPTARDADRTITDTHGYMDAIESELTALGLRATCDGERGRCTYDLDSEAARNVFSMVVQYDPTTATIMVYAERYLTAPTDNPRTDRLLQRLLELNWEQLAPMFQWDSGTGHVRLAAALNVDSNFDRRAFRGVVQSVHVTAERHYRALRTVLNP